MLIRSARPSSKMPCRTPGTPWPRLSGRVLRHFSPSRRCAFFYRILRSVLSLLPDALYLKYRSLLFRQREKVRFAEEIAEHLGKFPNSISVDRSCHAFSKKYSVVTIRVDTSTNESRIPLRSHSRLHATPSEPTPNADVRAVESRGRSGREGQASDFPLA